MPPLRNLTFFDASDARSERGDIRYAKLPAEQIPLTECLKDTVARVLPFWNESMAPAIRSGRRLVVAAHGNSIRALVKYLDGVSDSDIVGLNIPNGIPLVYEIRAFWEDAAVGNGHLEPGMELLTKPFTLDALAGKAAEMLEA